MPYADYTYKCKKPLRRYSHQRRIAMSLSFIDRYLPKNGSILDFGCADGYMLGQLGPLRPDCKATGFEPYPDADTPTCGVKIYHDYDRLLADGGKFDIVTCFEVLEHLSYKGREAVIGNITKLLKPGGILLMSVPVEYGIAGLAKGIIRRLTIKKLAPQYTAANLFRTLFALPVPGWRDGDGYLDHIGFYYRDLEPQVDAGFQRIERKWSPFGLGPALSSQVMAAYRMR